MHWVGAGSCKEQESPPHRRRAEARVGAQAAHGRPTAVGADSGCGSGSILGPNIFLASGTYGLPTREGGLGPAWGLKAFICPFSPYSQ